MYIPYWQFHIFLCYPVATSHNLISTKRILLSISCKGGLVLINSFSFCLGKSLSLLHFWRTVLPGIVFLVGRVFFFFFLHFKHFVPFPLAFKVLIKPGIHLFGVPLYVTSCFSLDSLKILSLLLTFDNLIIMCLGVNFFEINLFVFFGLPKSGCCVLPQFGKFFYYFFE